MAPHGGSLAEVPELEDPCAHQLVQAFSSSVALGMAADCIDPLSTSHGWEEGLRVGLSQG